MHTQKIALYLEDDQDAGSPGYAILQRSLMLPWSKETNLLVFETHALSLAKKQVSALPRLGQNEPSNAPGGGVVL
jgi:hypothetical protein